MGETDVAGLLAALVSFPTVVFTVLLGLALVYWVFVIVGALDIDMFDADGLFEGADGALDGVDGALDGVDGALDGVDGALDADALDAIDGADGAAGLLHALKLRRAPITVTFSFIALFGFIFSYLAMAYLGPLVGALLPVWAFGSAVLVAAFALSLPLTSLATKPLEPIFKPVSAKGRRDYVGAVVQVRTGRVDDGFGQADLMDEGSHLVVPVRIDVSTLKRGDRALIIDYDAEREAYVVEAYDSLMSEESPS
ncbi:MAG: glycine zipper family protein [Myxococcota bacterium]